MNANGTMYRGRDLLVLKKTLCEEIARVNEVLLRLQYRCQHLVAPDLSKDELLEIFREEHARLLRQLQAIDASLLKATDTTAPTLVEEHRQMERWRNTLETIPPTAMRH
ncbi:hypothetical protein [Noviherbaspirillum aerium]|uniref:hypothetical protein n=1 Tax=Noviherbaspirillum aerium TaxID=2588497 RepID=UPI00124DDDE1|nr:hypothetical protein [Noviherbaspirillum aerium]